MRSLKLEGDLRFKNDNGEAVVLSRNRTKKDIDKQFWLKRELVGGTVEETAISESELAVLFGNCITANIVLGATL